MKTFEINKITRITNNTAEYGFGDYTDKKYEVVAIIKADNIRKAQSIYKREYDKSAKFNRWSKARLFAVRMSVIKKQEK